MCSLSDPDPPDPASPPLPALTTSTVDNTGGPLRFMVWMGYGVTVRGHGVDVRGYGMDVRGYGVGCCRAGGAAPAQDLIKGV
eukprot:1190388-Prorocentrum_minimum.AAC.1